ncbi:hypothetical protein [Winogradskyella sp. A3E31]|uniref:hypothetical protein n=1 Tax=Winogradskyella sp. A3E31 TaxID=3349637 RepID=UPI00398AE10C
MKKVMLFLFVAILATSCNAQNSKDKSSKIEIEKNSLNEPKGSWKVNKEVDKNGNIIRYDSIYTWSSSRDLKSIDADSIFNKMQNRFSMFQSPRMYGFTEHDSIMKQFFSDDFFKDNFFSSGSPSTFPNMDDMIKRMEAMREQFFNDNHRYIIPPEETKKKEKKANTIEKKRA